MTKSTKQQGFTLVELSIVLVIIGLLIGGILAAQSMIGTTKVQAFTRQIGQFDAAVMNFKDKFGGLPGDTSTMGCTVATNNACGDNLITSGVTATGLFDSEVGNFWPNLQTSGFTSEGGGTYTATVTTSFKTIGTAPNSPAGKIGANTGFIVAGSTAAVVGNSGTAATQNNYYAASWAGMTSSTIAAAAAFTGPDALAIDTKLDNGVGTTGNVSSFDLTGVLTSTLATNASVAYVVTNSNPTYGLAIRMGATAGNPQ